MKTNCDIRLVEFSSGNGLLPDGVKMKSNLDQLVPKMPRQSVIDTFVWSRRVSSKYFTIVVCQRRAADKALLRKSQFRLLFTTSPPVLSSYSMVDNSIAYSLTFHIPDTLWWCYMQYHAIFDCLFLGWCALILLCRARLFNYIIYIVLSIIIC